MTQHRRTRAPLVALALLMLCTTGCSVIGRSYCWQPEVGDTETTVNSALAFIFQYGKADLTVDNFACGGDSYFLGPPVIPIIPRFLLPPYRKHYYSSILIYINSPSDTTIVDFSKIRLWYSEEKTLKLRKVEEWTKKELTKGILEIDIPIARTTIADRKASFMLTFEEIPYSVEEFRVEFGTFEVDGNEVKVPLLKWRLESKYKYIPFYFD